MTCTVTEHNGEHLKMIKNHPRYFVSDTGSVYSYCSDELRLLHPDILPNGHARVTLDGKKEYIASLVMDTFNPNYESNMYIFHVDGDKLNNDLSNLVWLSKSDIHLYSQYLVSRRKDIFNRN